VGVDEELWILDRQGHRTGVRNVRDLGFREGISNIVLAPDNEALLTSRDDRDWQVVSRFSLARVRSIRPQWPEDIAKLPLNAVHLAMSPDGDIAAATGGGHTVLLFDRDGRLLARTPPDTYRFTNGLWWSPEGWWTTDTNRFALRLLDPRTLQVRRTVQLTGEPAGTPFLGEAIASRGGPQKGGTQRPFATVSRLGTLMEPGHAVDVYPDGSQVLFNLDTIAQLRDLAWFDGHLLLVDGGRFELRRFDSEHRCGATCPASWRGAPPGARWRPASRNWRRCCCCSASRPMRACGSSARSCRKNSSMARPSRGCALPRSSTGSSSMARRPARPSTCRAGIRAGCW
jgi:hypothetical protein